MLCLSLPLWLWTHSFQGKSPCHCVVKKPLFRRLGSLNWVFFLPSSSSTPICFSVVVLNTIYSTCIILSLSTMSYMKLAPTLHSIELTLETNCTNHCWTSSVLFFFLTTGGRQGHWALSEVFHQRNWCSWYSRAHELSPQAALTIVFFHSMSNWVGIARPPVGHSNWGDMETLLPLPGIQGI